MIQPTFSPFPSLTTARLSLRAVELTDAPEIFFLRSDPDVLKYVDRTAATNIEDAENFIRQNQQLTATNESILWAITLKNTKALIGTIGFWRMEKENHRAEVGYVLHPQHQRKGIMTEALNCVTSYGFHTMGLHTIAANINPANDASRQLLLACGFVKEAYFREDFYFQGKFIDSEIYGLLNA